MTKKPERLNLNSHDIVGDKLKELLVLFPEVRTEDSKIDFERLKLTLGETVQLKANAVQIFKTKGITSFKTV